MPLSSRSVLDIIELVYYVPALLVALALIRKEGSRSHVSAWHYIAILGIIRIVSGATGLAAAQNPSQSLIETSFITKSVGLTPLLLALLDILDRINSAMDSVKLHSLVSHVIRILVLIGLVIAIVGGLKIFDSNAGTRQIGWDLLKSCAVIYGASLLVLAGIALLFAIKARKSLANSTTLMYAAVISLPFLSVRVAYFLAAVFDHHSTSFNLMSNTRGAVIVQGVMGLGMEFCAVALYLGAGLAMEKAMECPKIAA